MTREGITEVPINLVKVVFPSMEGVPQPWNDTPSPIHIVQQCFVTSPGEDSSYSDQWLVRCNGNWAAYTGEETPS